MFRESRILRTIDDRYTLRRVVDCVRDMGIRIDADIIKRAGLDDIDKEKSLEENGVTSGFAVLVKTEEE